MINRDEIRRKLAVKIYYFFRFIKAHLMEETPQYKGRFLGILKQIVKKDK